MASDLPPFSISQISTLPQAFDDDLTTYRAAGADGIGLWEIKFPERDDAETLARVRESNLAVTNCVGAVPSILPLPLLPGPEDPAERVEAFRRWIRRIAPFEPDCLVLLTGPAGERDPAAARALVVDALRTLGDAAERAGVRIALEAYQRVGGEDWTIVSTLAEAAALLDEADNPALGLIADNWHLWNTSYEEELPAVSDRIVGVHVSDYREPTRGWLDRVLPGDGVGDVPRFLAAIDAAGWTGPYDVEIFSDDGTFGGAYPDSLWSVPGDELARRAKGTFARCWQARSESA
ncbi:MAG: sugar phosphate isomerase/epimerase family protein [Gaiellaceae bacterium]